jgi:hypothetical protein
MAFRTIRFEAGFSHLAQQQHLAQVSMGDGRLALRKGAVMVKRQDWCWLPCEQPAPAGRPGEALPVTRGPAVEPEMARRQ